MRSEWMLRCPDEWYVWGNLEGRLGRTAADLCPSPEMKEPPLCAIETGDVRGKRVGPDPFCGRNPLEFFFVKRINGGGISGECDMFTAPRRRVLTVPFCIIYISVCFGSG